jgi:hypothetical protein
MTRCVTQDLTRITFGSGTDPANTPTSIFGDQGEHMLDQVPHQAVSRLFDLVRNGEVDNLEFTQLDSLVYGALERTYQVDEADQAERQVQAGAA